MKIKMSAKMTPATSEESMICQGDSLGGRKIGESPEAKVNAYESDVDAI